MVDREFGIDTGRRKKIGGDFCLSKKIAPETGMKLAVIARQDSKWFLNVSIARSAGFAW